MTDKNASSVPIKGLTDKRNITLTFTISFSGEFLPMQIIYQGKTPASQPKNTKFPSGFLITQNPKHYSNETETLKLLDKVIKPYVEKKKKELNLPQTQKSLLVWDVFRGQKTDKVMSKLSSMNVEAVSVPANMTHFFQPLDLTVNGEAKRFMKERFTKWYAEEIQTQMESGVRTEDIMVDLRLTVIKPLHASELANVNHFLTEK